MKIAFKTLLLLLPFCSLQANEDDQPEDQFVLIFGSNSYVLYKTLDFANDHGVRYIKILSFEFSGYGHKFSGFCETDTRPGRYLEYKDEYVNISYLCFDEDPNDPFVIDLEKYRAILEQEENED